MATVDKSSRLHKEITLLGVYAIATGATLSAGLFLLPGLAAQQAGPAIVLCYLLAIVPLVPAMLSAVELATAMPRAGGAYYFLDRSLGPLAGAVGGLGTWMALTLKTAFALVGMGFYLKLFWPDAPEVMVKGIAVGFALLFGAVNLVGSKKSGLFQIVLLCGLLAILAWFMMLGSTKVELSHFQGFFDAGSQSIFSTAGLVYISYVGVTKVASISEEVKNPDKNLPRGVFLSLGTAVLVYGVCTYVMVGVLPMTNAENPEAQLANNYTPMAAVAFEFAGNWGKYIVSVAALLAFAAVANAGILSASRYPLAMARDHLIPGVFRKLNKRQTPGVAIAVTVGAILVFVLLFNPLEIAKLASAFQLFIFALLCLAVIVMRESKIESYDPGYCSPLYPWMQIFGIIAPFGLIAMMGLEPILFSIGLIAVSVIWFYCYASKRVKRHGAIYHVFERLGRRRFEALDIELRTILKEKGLRDEDPFDEIIVRAAVIEVGEGENFEGIVRRASLKLAEHLPCDAETLEEGFLEGTRTGATPVSHGAALPHLRRRDIHAPHLAIVRSQAGVEISTGDVFGETRTMGDTHAIFFLVSPDDDPGQHLRMLAQLASRVDQDGFIEQWRGAEDEYRLKEILLHSERHISLLLSHNTRTESLIDCAIREVVLPEGCLVVMIRRGEQSIIPTGKTMLRAGDRLTFIGDEEAIRAMHEEYGVLPTREGES